MSDAASEPVVRQKVCVRINGRDVEREVPARLLLADFIRHEAGLKGTHIGCEHGVCGACTVLLDGSSVRSCLTFAIQAHGREVTTVEGLSPRTGLSVLQRAFKSSHALQCGFCTPGILIAVTELLAMNPDPTEAQVRTALDGNLCRCTGYVNIVDAVLNAAREMRGAP